MYNTFDKSIYFDNLLDWVLWIVTRYKKKHLLDSVSICYLRFCFNWTWQIIWFFKLNWIKLKFIFLFCWFTIGHYVVVGAFVSFSDSVSLSLCLSVSLSLVVCQYFHLHNKISIFHFSYSQPTFNNRNDLHILLKWKNQMKIRK